MSGVRQWGACFHVCSTTAAQNQSINKYGSVSGKNKTLQDFILRAECLVSVGDHYLQDERTCAISEMWRLCWSRMTPRPTIRLSQCLRFGPKCPIWELFRCFYMIYIHRVCLVCSVWVVFQLLRTAACFMMNSIAWVFIMRECVTSFISMQYFVFLCCVLNMQTVARLKPKLA